MTLNYEYVILQRWGDDRAAGDDGDDEGGNNDVEIERNTVSTSRWFLGPGSPGTRVLLVLITSSQVALLSLDASRATFTFFCFVLPVCLERRLPFFL